MKNIKIGHRLGLAFMCIAVLLGIGAAQVHRNTSEALAFMHDTAERRLPLAVTAGQFTASLLQTARHTRNMLILDEPAKIKGEVEATRKTIQERAEHLQTLEKNIRNPTVRAQLDAVKTVRAQYLPLEAAYLELIEQQKIAEAKPFLLEKMRPVQVAYVAELEKLVEIQRKVTSEAVATQIIAAEAREFWLMSGLCLVLVLLVLTAWLTTRSIVQPLQRAVAFSGEIAAGNLRTSVVVDRKDELGQLMESLNTMQTSLADMVRQVQRNANEVATLSHELAATAEQVSQATDSQSEAASSMAASVEQMTVSVAHISESAQMATNKTAQSSELAQRGQSVVTKAGSEMNDIADGINRSAEFVKVLQNQTREISSIAGVIRNIAEQTNLLALNAAIEAARAGEEGRGFAVVADAVRGLAERTTQSTAEIAATIEKVQASTDRVFQDMGESVSRAQSGLAFSQEAGEAIVQVSSSAAEVLTAVGEISAALHEQSQASNQIARHVENIAQMAQENSAAVDQTKATAKSLQDLSATLQTSAMRFTV